MRLSDGRQIVMCGLRYEDDMQEVLPPALFRRFPRLDSHGDTNRGVRGLIGRVVDLAVETPIALIAGVALGALCGWLTAP